MRLWLQFTKYGVRNGVIKSSGTCLEKSPKPTIGEIVLLSGLVDDDPGGYHGGFRARRRDSPDLRARHRGGADRGDGVRGEVRRRHELGEGEDDVLVMGSWWSEHDLGFGEGASPEQSTTRP
ncbi:hypothetical protein DY000_02034734 [Brassica cretica]|uniref:Uncharacterized protein n=1 Tax=Brassica cretica TaxID=69181 RepID=A0ABQ7DGV5_BRACR|nr:hypothetical protein DY000_02034734 [Brassica cretica]